MGTFSWPEGLHVAALEVHGPFLISNSHCICFNVLFGSMTEGMGSSNFYHPCPFFTSTRIVSTPVSRQDGQVLEFCNNK